MMPYGVLDMPRSALWFMLMMLAVPLILSACARVAVKPPPPPPPLPVARQAVVVTTPDWNAVAASLQRYERGEAGAPWLAVGERIAAVVGRNGLGWGRGIQPRDAQEGPVKREGDGRAPGGVFKLRSAFGYQPVADVPWIRLPYRQATTTLKCVDDPASPLYNCLVDTLSTAETWNSHENMLRKDDLYRLGVVVGHNDDPPVAGGGSCIFLHIWQGPDRGTAGCTAMAPLDIGEILRWLDPAKLPVLVQLVEGEYRRLRTVWDLP